jgi:micrococcal nuclease
MHPMRRSAVAGFAVLALAAVVVKVERGSGAAPAVRDPGAVASPAIPGGSFVARVDRVVDGDTFIAQVAGSSRPVRVRIIGADTPETVKPGVAVRCYGPQASAFTKHLLPKGSWIRAAYEPGGQTDKYGRQLWDVWLPDGRFLESVLVASGAARAYPFAPQLDNASLLADLQSAARQSRVGLWGPPCRGDSFS